MTGDQRRRTIYTRSRSRRGSGPLEMRIASPSQPISFAAQAMILLPVLMWALAALVSWWLVHRLLIRPLRKLQRASPNISPATMPRVLPNRTLARRPRSTTCARPSSAR